MPNIKPLKTNIHWRSLFCAIGLLALNAAHAEPRPGDIQVPSTAYPKVYYRGPEYGGKMNCIASPAPSPLDEVYMVKAHINDLPVGKKRDIEVAEFFSGKRYQAQAINEGASQVRLFTAKRTQMLECIVGNIVSFGKTSPINAQGDYLNYENVDVLTGKWGDFYVSNKCDVGVWEACDLGLKGFSRRRSDGTVVWARLLAVATTYASGRGHPVWNVPDALNVLDGNWNATWLSDGTALFTMDGGDRNSGPTVRVNMGTGELMETHAEVAMVPLDDWATLKRVLHSRWTGATDPCNFQRGEDQAQCGRKLTEMYFYAQQNYLFPLLTSLSKTKE